MREKITLKKNRIEISNMRAVVQNRQTSRLGGTPPLEWNPSQKFNPSANSGDWVGGCCKLQPRKHQLSIRGKFIFMSDWVPLKGKMICSPTWGIGGQTKKETSIKS